MTAVGLDLERVAILHEREMARFATDHPISASMHERGRSAFLYGAPLHWMGAWAGTFPVSVSDATGAHVRDVDGHEYIDLCLGDSAAMFGHAHPAITEAIQRQAARGVTTMLPDENGLWVAEELQRRFGLPYWQLATSATDANRFALRLARMATGRNKVLVFNGNYHGSVDESQVELDLGGGPLPRANVHPNGIDHRLTTRVVEFNDLAALEAALRHEDVACVMTEPLLTNLGMVPARPGFHAGLRELTRRHGTLLLIDETHTISNGPAGCVGADGLEPDLFVLGKAIGGGIPTAVYGASATTADLIWDAKPPVWKVGVVKNQHGGFGGTLVGNHLALAAMRATLEHVMVPETYAYMIALTSAIADGVEATIDRHDLPWHVTRVGARAEYMFLPGPPLNGTEARTGRESHLEALIHLYLLNRGVLLAPFHNMVLSCPALTSFDVAVHTDAFAACIDEVTR
ncbi:MAG: aspartate aminotransferase family protein [Acidimicrobiales bacterium]